MTASYFKVWWWWGGEEFLLIDIALLIAKNLQKYSKGSYFVKYCTYRLIEKHPQKTRSLETNFNAMASLKL